MTVHPTSRCPAAAAMCGKTPRRDSPQVTVKVSGPPGIGVPFGKPKDEDLFAWSERTRAMVYLPGGMLSGSGKVAVNGPLKVGEVPPVTTGCTVPEESARETS